MYEYFAELAAHVDAMVKSQKALLSSLTNLLSHNSDGVPLAMEIVLRSTRVLTAMRRALQVCNGL